MAQVPANSVQSATGASIGLSGQSASQASSSSGSSAESSIAKPVKMLGRFRLISVLGQGAMGKVIRAEDSSLKRQVALKVLPFPKLKTYKVEQFVREARSAATLEHPNIVHIYEVGQAAGHHYIAMELIEGGDLASIVKASGPFDIHRTCTVGAETAEALAYAAQLGVVHRDVKPENLMLTRAGRCKLADFGLARIDDPSDGFRLPSEAVGTPNYMSPEVIQGSPATAKSDVYSLGAVLFYLLVGRAPFGGKSRDETLNLHITAPAPDIRAIRPEVPEGLARLIWQAMAKDPESRPAADVMAKVLRSFTIGNSSRVEGGMASTDATPAAKAAGPSKNVMVYMLIAGLAGAVLIIGIVSWLFYIYASAAYSFRPGH